MRIVRRNPVVFGLLLAGLALVMGYLGFRALPEPAMTRSDALYATLQLFVLEGAVYPNTPWALNIARFLAPLALAYATVATVAVFLQRQIQRRIVATFAHDHTVLVTPSDEALTIARAFQAATSKPVVVLDQRPSARFDTATIGRGVRVLEGDPADGLILDACRVAQANHVVIHTGDDGRNLEVAARIRRLLVEASPSRPPVVHVEISDLALWSELVSMDFQPAADLATVDFYNLADRSAQRLLDAAERDQAGPLTAVFLEGDGSIAQRTLMHLVRRAALMGARPRLWMSHDTRRDVLDPLLGTNPWLADALETVRVELGDSRVSSSVPSAIVCLSAPDSVSISRAISIARAWPGLSVHATVHGDELSDAALASTSVAGRLHLVPTGSQALARDLLTHSPVELMARVRHEDYVASERERGIGPEANPSLVSWDSLTPSLKESNRRFAESVGAFVSSLGGRLVPLRGLLPDRGLVDDPETLEYLAKDEHDRWMASLTADGWTYSPIAKDPDRKTHPLLVAWDDLEEAEREKDRDAIRAIPRMLGRVGLGVELPGNVADEAP